LKSPAGILGLIVLLVAAYNVRQWFRTRLLSATGRAPSCLTVAGYTTAEDEGRTYIVGNIQNNCGRKFSSITVLFKLDRMPGPTENPPEAVVYAYSRDLAPGETRRFKSFFPISANATFRFDGINAY
jgi:hypothetical protein